MKRLLATAALAAGVAALAIAPATMAITYGGPDGNGHPEVGMLLAQQAFSDGTWEECSGTLISPTVFLTAAHCDEGVSRVAVSFDSAYVAGKSPVYWGTWHANPAYNHTESDPGDVAVVVFDKPIKGITPARLPAAHSLDSVNTTTQFTPVGFGGQAVTNGPGGKTIHYQDVRYFGTGELNSLTTSWLHISGNPSNGNSNTCYGDSGGPNFLGAGSTETNIVAGTTITGDAWCRSTNVDYRMDTDSARTFLASYVSLP